MRCRPSGSLLALFILPALLGSATSLSAQDELSTAKARLVKPLDGRSPDGASFYVNTINPWHSGNCEIRVNTMIEGHISSWKHRKDGSRQEELSLRFEPLACYGSETMRVVPVLAALRGPREDREDAGLREAEAKQAMISMIVTRPMRAPGGKEAGSALPGAESQQIASFGQAGHPDLTGMKTGEVRDIHGVKMTLPAAGSDTTTLVSSHAIGLPAGTNVSLAFFPPSQMVLEPAGKHEPSSEMAGVTIAASREEAAPIPVEEQVKVCAAGCSQLDTTTSVATSQSSWTVSLASMGLRPRLGQVRVDVDDDASVHFLRDEEVLVTFNDHTLTRRSQDVGPRPRHIRAVVLSRKDGHILQTQEWPVYDDRQYTWDLGDGRVLAHVGHELVIYGLGLVIEHQYRLTGAVSFVEVAPVTGAESGLIAVATVHEKHTPVAHEKLVSFFGPDWPIDEDYDLTMLDKNLSAIGTRHLDAKPARVALQTTGMISAQHISGDNWRLEQESWTGSNETLAGFHSGCKVAVTSLPGKLLFAKACAADRASTFYWILNSQGSVLLAGHSPGTEMVQQAHSSTSGNVFAVATTQSEEPIDLAVGAKVSDFRSLTVSAYRVSDGRKLFAAHLAEGSALRQTFALAPSGESLAVLSGSTVREYALHP